MTGETEPIQIRPYRDSDAEEAARIFFDAVHEGTKAFYSPAQRRAWAGEAPEPDDWRRRLGFMTTFVAEMAGAVVGFMTIDRDGLIDLAFVAPTAVGRGIGWRLYQTVEDEARRLGVTRLHSEASLKARPFFERQGFRVVQQQSVKREGIALTNFKMEKLL